jgi:hypothetical protein
VSSPKDDNSKPKSDLLCKTGSPTLSKVPDLNHCTWHLLPAHVKGEICLCWWDSPRQGTLLDIVHVKVQNLTLGYLAAHELTSLDLMRPIAVSNEAKGMKAESKVRN